MQNFVIVSRYTLQKLRWKHIIWYKVSYSEEPPRASGSNNSVVGDFCKTKSLMQLLQSLKLFQLSFSKRAG